MTVETMLSRAPIAAGHVHPIPVEGKARGRETAGVSYVECRDETECEVRASRGPTSSQGVASPRASNEEGAAARRSSRSLAQGARPSGAICGPTALAHRQECVGEESGAHAETRIRIKWRALCLRKRR